MSLLEKFNDYVHREKLFAANDLLLIATSGGVDSVVLCELCYQAGFDFVMGHCNFQLRGPESDRDEAFVRSLANKYSKKVVVKKFDTEQYAQQNKVSTQVAARELRYSWFSELLSPVNKQDQIIPSCLLTAHHGDDNVETLLMNFFKGTGIAGLRGILPKQGKIIRPLLPFRKTALITFANSQQLKWVDDSSNASHKYSRNYFRQQIIPLVQKIYPAAEENLLANTRRFSDIEILYQQAIAIHKKKLIEVRGNEIHIPVLKLQQSQPLDTIVFEIIKDYHFSPAQTNEVVSLLQAESGKYVQSATHRVIRNRKWLIIAPIANEGANNIIIEKEDTRINAPDFSLQIEQFGVKRPELSSSPNIAFIDIKQVKFPLLLRKWKAGDYFYPLGMKKKKKLARFFIDQKLSKTQKENAWVIESDKKIIWVVGMRIDDRFKISDRSQSVLKITVQNG